MSQDRISGTINVQQILERLEQTATPYKLILSFSDIPGIYAIYYCGSDYLQIKGISISPECLLYIGKTESSQLERDAKQHFVSGETGRSTLRRSLGALLRDQLNLIPIPRSNTEQSDRKFTHYKFDEVGESSLNSWMVRNLAVSFYEYSESPDKIEELERQLISLAVPPLNIKDNPNSRCKEALKLARAECVQLAHSNNVDDPAVVSHTIMKDDHTPVRKQMYLHDAIADVLLDCPERTADSESIAKEIAKRGTYLRPKDSQPPEAWQIELRAGKPQYSRLFEVFGNRRIRLR